MIKKLLAICAVVALILSVQTNSYAQQQLTDEEYSYVTMDLQGILSLTMTTEPQVDFVFKTIQEYNHGITKFNAVKLNVDATVGWDLYAFALTGADNVWDSVETYSTNGTSNIPAEVLMIRASNGYGEQTTWPVMHSVTDTVNFQDFTPITGQPNAGLGANLTPGITTQFIAGSLNAVIDTCMNPGTALTNPTTHQFRLDYRIVPGIPAKFLTALSSSRLNQTASAIDPDVTYLTNASNQNYARAGYYYLQIAYILTEDL